MPSPVASEANGAGPSGAHSAGLELGTAARLVRDVEADDDVEAVATARSARIAIFRRYARSRSPAADCPGTVRPRWFQFEVKSSRRYGRFVFFPSGGIVALRSPS